MTPKELKSGEETLIKHISQALTETQKSNADGLILTEQSGNLPCNEHILHVVITAPHFQKCFLMCIPNVIFSDSSADFMRHLLPDTQF